MKIENVPTSVAVDDIKFDAYGNYAISEIPFGELEEIGGGWEINVVCPGEINNNCPKKGEDGDEE